MEMKTPHRLRQTAGHLENIVAGLVNRKAPPPP